MDLSIFDQREHEQQQAKKRNYQSYRQLVSKLASKGKLTSSEALQLTNIMDALGISSAQGKADVAAIIAIDRAEKAVTAGKDAAEKLPGEISAKQQIDADADAAVAAAAAPFRAAALPHVLEINRLNTLVNALPDAEARLKELQQKHRQLLDLPDPAAARNTLHIQWLAEGATAAPANDGIPTITIESVMAAPADLNGHFAATSQYRFVPTEGQDQADVDRLVALAQEIVETHGAFPRTVQYLNAKAYDGSLNRGLYINGLTDVQSPALALFVALPGQGFDEIAELISALEKRYVHRISAPIGQDKDTGPEPVSRWRKRRGARREIDPKNLTDEILVLGLPTPQPESESNGLRVVAGA